MTLSRIVLTSIMALLAFLPGAWSVNIGGGNSVIVTSPGEVQGNFVADNGGAASTVISTGPVTLGQLYWVQDYSGKRAEIMLDVVNGQISKYRAEFRPRQGIVPTTDMVSAKQTLDISGADMIKTHAKALGANGGSASVDLQIDRVGSYGAQFKGETDSYATANSAFANADGNLMGALNGKASANGLDVARDSSDGIVSCDLIMNAKSTNKMGSVGGKATFNVDDDWSGKIQSAVDAALDGDMIKVAAGTYSENIKVDKSLEIDGAGSSKTIVKGIGDRSIEGSVFKIGLIDKNANVILSGMTIQNGFALNGDGGGIDNMGTLTVKDSRIYSNAADIAGGGICNDGTLVLKNSEITSNMAGMFIGGGIYNSGTATIIGSKITDNSALSSGGGIYNSGILTVKDSEISDNSVYEPQLRAFGGGILNIGTATVMDSKISGNLAYYGGGIDSSGTATITNSEIFGNRAWASAGGIRNGGTLDLRGSKIFGNTAEGDGGDYSSGDPNIGVRHGYGGGILNRGTAAITSSTISCNKAYELGGGVYNTGELKLTRSYITGNAAVVDGGGVYNYKGSLTLNNNNIAQNMPNNVVLVSP